MAAFLLFLMLLASPALLLADTCTPDVSVEGKEKEITRKKNETRFTLFVQPHQTFDGVILEITGNNGSVYKAWFEADEKCFPRDGNWWHLLAQTGIRDNDVLSFVIFIGSCIKHCHLVINSSENIKSFAVKARGNSDWITGQPNCNVKYRNAAVDPPNGPQCAQPSPLPSSSPPSTSSSNTAPVVIGVMVTVVILALALQGLWLIE